MRLGTTDVHKIGITKAIVFKYLSGNQQKSTDYSDHWKLVASIYYDLHFAI